MIDSADELRPLLCSTILGESEIVEVPVLDTGERALAVEIAGSDVEQSWRVARELLDRTGRWPVLSAFWSGSGGSFSERLAAEELFSRFYYEEEPNAGDVTPQAIIRRSRDIEARDFADGLAADRAQEEDVGELLEVELDETRRVCGRAPEPHELAPLASIHDLDRRLLEWELAHGGLGDPAESRLEWVVPEQVYLLLLPTVSSWEVLAYLHFFGASYHGSEQHIALGSSWRERFGAELVAHYGTMLQCMVSRPPTDPHEAWSAGREHDLMAPCTLASPGLSLRHYANGLVQYDRWCLHERP